MKRRMWMFLIMAMLLRWVYWAAAAARPFPTCSFAANSRPAAFDQTAYIHHSPQSASDSKQGGDERGKIGGEEYRRVSRVGSRPPSCEHKCEGCNPCKPIQIPATTTIHLNLHYANYEPEGWKCKCGTSFFNP